MGHNLVCSFKLVPNIAEEAKTRALDTTGTALKDEEITQQCKKRKLFWVGENNFSLVLNPELQKQFASPCHLAKSVFSFKQKFTK